MQLHVLHKMGMKPLSLISKLQQSIIKRAFIIAFEEVYLEITLTKNINNIRDTTLGEIICNRTYYHRYEILLFVIGLKHRESNLYDFQIVNVYG